MKKSNPMIFTLQQWRNKISLIMIPLFLTLSYCLNAQVSLCAEISDFDPDYVISTSGTPASFNLPNPVSGLDIQIDGTLLIPSDFEFNDCDIRMGPNASIIVYSDVKLTLTQTDIFACAPNMWNGIWARDRSTIVMSQCRLSDALNGLNCKGSGIKLFLSQNTFSWNLIGINCEPSFGPTGSTRFLQFEGNKFDGFPYALNDGTGRAFAGIRVYKSKTNIGGGLTNSFKDAINGIYCELSTLKVERCTFENNKTGIFALDSRLTQIGLGQLAPLPSFKVCEIGIRVKSSILDCSSNYFDNCRDVTVKVDGANPLSDIHIWNNYFYNHFDIGVSGTGQFAIKGQISFEFEEQAPFQTQVNGLSIHDNGFYINLPPENTDFSAIFITSTLVSSKYDIYDNDFQFTNKFELGEIRGDFSVAPFRFINNDVYCLGVSSGIFHLHSFANNGGELVTNNIVEDCDVIGVLPVSSAGQHLAFRSENCHINWCNNSVENMPNGIQFFGNCDNSYLSSMQFGGNLKKGLLINEGAFIGLQDLRANSWPVNPVFQNARCAGSPQLSRFNADFSIPGHDPINPIPASGWFTDIPGSNGCVPPPPTEGFTGNRKELLDGNINDNNTDPLSLWQIRKDLVNTLFYHPELRASGSAGAVFYSQFSSHLTGQFATADRTFKDALRLTDLQRQSADNLLASIKNHLETMKNLDNLQAVNPGDLDIQSDWEAEELELQNDITTWESLILEVKNARQSALLATLSLYEQIIPMEQWEINEKNLSSLVIQQLTQTSTMSATDELNLLRSIAAQCTYTGGEPVSIARSLLPVNEYKAYKAMEEEPECGQDSERSKDVDQENNNNTEITISPNPAGDYFRLNLSEKSDSRLIVTDLMGRVVDSQSAHSEKVINYNTSSWPTGTYQITVIEIGGQVSIVHFTVQH